ncbi:hypothetical protein MGYG_00109 [Nannizzia gypsea CBS 118893]|uniref:Uncharacterized protein n=1 Tax=Arthroderma gypseum (strain ATCC MYA-4604 / CBS 118893) TaxID=535722 RepID=E5R2T1_ARTGP|nr:hypothetical protein MGYG_00109 [Nannizzia gypsea CBS 118893]EFQ97065.1 hypothetical protein MGYG_00109 [Nannizzia gypsea CBS 118893]
MRLSPRIIAMQFGGRVASSMQVRFITALTKPSPFVCPDTFFATDLMLPGRCCGSNCTARPAVFTSVKTPPQVYLKGYFKTFDIAAKG